MDDKRRPRVGGERAEFGKRARTIYCLKIVRTIGGEFRSDSTADVFIRCYEIHGSLKRKVFFDTIDISTRRGFLLYTLLTRRVAGMLIHKSTDTDVIKT